MKIGRLSFPRNNLVIALLLIMLIILSSCSCENSCPRCISADDFGMPKTSVSGSFKKGSNEFKADNGESSDGKHPNQAVRWKETGLVTSGETLRIRTKGKWVGVGNIDGKPMPTTCADKSNTVTWDKFCTYVDTEYQDPITGCVIKGIKLDEESEDGDCWIRNGVGAYILLKRNGDPDPNESLDLIRNPKSPVLHIGYSDDEVEFESSNRKILDENCREIEIGAGWEIYIKIYDVFYWDNEGGYQIEVVSGVKNTYDGGFFESTRERTQKILKSSTKAIYEQITKNNNYINLVKALLVLYIVITGITFLLGMSQNTATELIIKVLKISIIIQLISPGSWDFFYNNLFALFIDGLDEILSLITRSYSGEEYNRDHPFASLDAIVSKLFTIYGGPKVIATMMATPWGFIWCFFILVILIIYVILVAYSVVIYLTALVGISVLIILMPILFLGLLFGPLKQTFDNWFTQATSFCVQAIMIFTLVSLFGSMIMNHIYRTLGYTTCCNKMFELNILPFLAADARQWTPGTSFIPYKIGLVNDLEVKVRYQFENKREIIKVPPEYKIEACRYIDYPFLDPKIKNEDCGNEAINGSGPDWDHIIRMRTSFQNGTINWSDLFTILLLSIMMYHMRTFVQNLGASIAGASPFQSAIGGAYEGAYSIGRLYGMAKQPIQQIWNNGIRGYSIPSLLNKLEELPAKIVRKATIGKFEVGKYAVDFVSAAKFAAGAESRLENEYLMKRQFKEIHHKQALLGYHLGVLKFGGEFSDSLGMKAMGKVAKHGIDRYITQEKHDGLIEGYKKLHSAELQKIRDYILGLKEPGPEKEIKEEKDAPAVKKVKESTEGASTNTAKRPELPRVDEQSRSLPEGQRDVGADEMSLGTVGLTEGPQRRGPDSPETISMELQQQGLGRDLEGAQSQSNSGTVARDVTMEDLLGENRSATSTATTSQQPEVSGSGTSGNLFAEDIPSSTSAAAVGKQDDKEKKSTEEKDKKDGDEKSDEKKDGKSRFQFTTETEEKGKNNAGPSNTGNNKASKKAGLNDRLISKQSELSSLNRELMTADAESRQRLESKISDLEGEISSISNQLKDE